MLIKFSLDITIPTFNHSYFVFVAGKADNLLH